MSETLDYLHMFARFPAALRRFLRFPLTLEEAERVAQERLAQRVQSFLRIVERSIYGYPGSPYLMLLRLAGCELGDLQALVREKGLEGALLALREAGVYVTFEEFKGRTPIVRHGRTIPVRPRDFDNPSARQDFAVQTGGSTGLATAVGQDLDYIAAGAAHQALMLATFDLWDAPAVHWQNSLPGNALRFIIQRAYLRQYPARWYLFSGYRDSKHWLKYGVASLAMVFWMRWYGIPVPLPRVARLEQAGLIAHWMYQTLKTHQRCLLYSSPSRALRVALAAQESGLDLTGATARIGGEPVTRAKVEAIGRSGMRCLTAYGMNETGTIGFGCPAQCAAEVDDVHLFHDAFALIAYPQPIEPLGLSVPAFNLTSLVQSSFKVMLNYQTDDYGQVESRSCGCRFESYGYTTHLGRIRSYSKLVGEAVSLIGDELLQTLEQVLPARYGGSPLDYQLLEEEDANGFTRLYLEIDPRLDIADEQEVIQIVYQALRCSSPMADAARTVWQQANTLQVRRQVPVATARGKLFPLASRRSSPYL